MKKPLWALALTMALLCGCTTEHYMTDARHPEIALTMDGGVTYRGKFVDPEDLPGLLKDSGLDKHDTINIHCPEEMNDWRLQRKVMAILSRNGFTRPVLAGDRKAYSEAGRTADERRRERVRQQREQEQKRLGERQQQRGKIQVKYKN